MDIRQNPLGSFSGEKEKHVFLCPIFHMDGCLMKQAHPHRFFAEPNPRARDRHGHASRLEGDSPFVKNDAARAQSRESSLTSVGGGERAKFPGIFHSFQLPRIINI